MQLINEFSEYMNSSYNSDVDQAIKQRRKLLVVKARRAGSHSSLMNILIAYQDQQDIIKYKEEVEKAKQRKMAQMNITTNQGWSSLATSGNTTQGTERVRIGVDGTITFNEGVTQSSPGMTNSAFTLPLREEYLAERVDPPSSGSVIYQGASQFTQQDIEDMLGTISRRNTAQEREFVAWTGTTANTYYNQPLSFWLSNKDKLRNLSPEDLEEAPEAIKALHLAKEQNIEITSEQIEETKVKFPNYFK